MICLKLKMFFLYIALRKFLFLIDFLLFAVEFLTNNLFPYSIISSQVFLKMTGLFPRLLKTWLLLDKMVRFENLVYFLPTSASRMSTTFSGTNYVVPDYGFAFPATTISHQLFVSLKLKFQRSSCNCTSFETELLERKSPIQP